MHEAIAAMMDRYRCRTTTDYTHALREIMQEVALLGLWRSRFFEKAAFYGGTALRVLHGLDRYSEDLDFSLLAADEDFTLGFYSQALQRELRAFGFEVEVRAKDKVAGGAIRSAFLKADTHCGVLVVTTDEDISAEIPRGRVLKIKLEVDTRPPGGFDTESRFLLQPIPFPVRTYTLPSLLAGKMHAVLCRGWRKRVKGRDWYDLIWYAARDVPLNLAHLQERMRQSGHLETEDVLTPSRFRELLAQRIESLDVDLARTDVLPFVRNPRALEVWSRDFFRAVAARIRLA